MVGKITKPKKPVDISPSYPFISSRDKIVDFPLDMGATISGKAGDRLVSTINESINQSGNLVKEVINAKLDTSAKQILGDFTFGASGAIKMITDANNGLWISPTGILAKKAGANTLVVTVGGDITMVGTITASAGSIGGWSISAAALYYDGATDAVSAGMASADYPFYAGAKYANRATAPVRITNAGIIYATGAVIDGTSTLGGRLGSTLASAINASGNLINDVVNTRLNSSTKQILDGFKLTASGALNISGTQTALTADAVIGATSITVSSTTGFPTSGVLYLQGNTNWMKITYTGVTATTFTGIPATGTGSITEVANSGKQVIGGPGVIITPKGLVTINSSGVETIVLEGSTGNATFAGTLSAATGTFGTITAGILEGAVTLGGRSGTILAGAINASGNLINNVINANLDTSAKQILGSFTFGASGSIAMVTDANNGLWLSPTGILGKKAGVNTFAIDTAGNATFAGTLSAATGTFGTITAGTLEGAVTLGGRSGTIIASAINASGNLITDIINARLDSSAKTILASFTFGTSGAIQIGTYVAGTSGDIKISPSGIVGRNSAGVNTFTIDGTTGSATFAGTLSAATGTLGALTIASGGNIKYNKTSFTDSTNAGYYMGSEGIYFGAAVDASKLKYTITDGSFDFIGTVSGRSTLILANSINASGNLITDLINARLDTSAKTILGDFTFGTSGAIKMITDVNNGLWLSPTGILGKKAGATTFAIDILGNATFAGTLSAASGSLGIISTGLITLDATGYIKGGQTAYNTGTGFFLGYSTDAYKFSIGNPASDYLLYDGTSIKLYSNTADGFTLDYGSNLLLKEGGSIKFTSVTAPTACTGALAGIGAGNVDNGAHIYKVTYVNASGETELGTASNTVTVVDKTLNGQVSLTSIPTSSSGSVTSRKIYRTKAGGSTYFLLATMNNNVVTTYTDNTADGSLGAEGTDKPNTSAGKIFWNTYNILNIHFDNTFVGVWSGKDNTLGNYNTFLGSYSGRLNTSGHSNTFIGMNAGSTNSTGIRTTSIGSLSGYSNNANNGVFLGFGAGYHETGSNKLFIDNATRTNEADARTKALIYGVFAAVTADQKLTINGLLNQSVSKTPASAAAAGTAGDICWDANYIYVCVATDTWKRTAITTW